MDFAGGIQRADGGIVIKTNDGQAVFVRQLLKHLEHLGFADAGGVAAVAVNHQVGADLTDNFLEAIDLSFDARGR